jgi:hypothetical protein
MLEIPFLQIVIFAIPGWLLMVRVFLQTMKPLVSACCIESYQQDPD